MAFSFSIGPVTMNDGTVIELPRTGLTVVVGANSVGKTRLLRDISEFIINASSGTVAKGIAVDKQGDDDDLETWLRTTAHAVKSAAGPRFSKLGSAIDLDQAQHQFQVGAPFQMLGNFLMILLNTEARLSLTDAPSNIKPLEGTPDYPIQALLLDPTLEMQISDEVERVFGHGVTVNRDGFGEIYLHGERIPRSIGSERTREEIETLLGVPQIKTKGDGVRSYTGILLAVTVAEYPVVLIDEPEAFLHPPAARALGRTLARKSVDSGQIIAATHSLDFLLGALEAVTEGANVSVLRLRLEGETNPTAVLSSETLKSTWANSLLRYSRVLEGLFHEGVVICESDTDCRFYNAVLDAAALSPITDLLFTHCGGKDRIGPTAAALKALAVPVVAIVDLDVLDDTQKFGALVETFGGRISDIEQDLSCVHDAITEIGAYPSTSEAREHVIQLLDEHRHAQLDEGVAGAIRAATRVQSGWKRIQRSGVVALGPTNADGACRRIISYCEALGLFIVDVGELEGWVPSIGGRSSRWLNQVLDSQAHLVALEAAQFMQRVSGSLNQS